eukprot:4333933-Alexandrium_andersonii.AAC.1
MPLRSRIPQRQHGSAPRAHAPTGCRGLPAARASLLGRGRSPMSRSSRGSSRGAKVGGPLVRIAVL